MSIPIHYPGVLDTWAMPVFDMTNTYTVGRMFRKKYRLVTQMRIGHGGLFSLLTRSMEQGMV